MLYVKNGGVIQAAIRKLVVDSVSVALEAQAATMTNTDNTNTGPREDPIARKCSYKEFMSCQPFIFKDTKSAVGLIRWFERTKSVFLRSNCTEDCKVKLSTSTLTEEALSWWNSFAQPIRIEEAYKITCIMPQLWFQISEKLTGSLHRGIYQKYRMQMNTASKLKLCEEPYTNNSKVMIK
ncbi:hypothetical protein Tco_0011163 [Tanacetum coccineum]